MADYHVPDKVMRRAIAIIREQQQTPTSPARVLPCGKVALCAAGALAFAAIEEVKSKKEARKFARQLCSASGAKVLDAAFIAFGWGLSFCREVKIINDDAPPSEREQVVTSFFESLLIEPCS